MNSFKWIAITLAVAFSAACAGCGGDDRCATSHVKFCNTSSDCELVVCGCCYERDFEVLASDCVDDWLQRNECDQTKVCLAIACNYPEVVCEDNLCVANWELTGEE